ncbi:MAG: ABC transporter ATP-binding protein [Ruminococcaceae bacterium]|nr:ABC transporter ATP-binding protein [Oscillospiraceae bacterium]
MNKQPAIKLCGITKSFGSVVANHNIDLTVQRGEILALLGENGSGKTTLMNILAGIYQPESGEIYIDGQRVSIHSPEDANRLGIGMIHQHFKLVDIHTAADNIILGNEPKGLFLQKSRFDKVRELSERFGLSIDPMKKIYNMSVSEKQTVEILKVLYRGANILILDEPTAVLTVQEIRRLFDILRRMRDEGCAVVIITHKLDEVMEISDRVTVLRKGESVETVDTASCDIRKLTELMVGRPVELSIDRPERTHSGTLLEIHHLTVESEEGVRMLDDVNMTLKKGEILGVAGVAGSGQRELCETIAGLMPIKEGAILFNKKNIENMTARQIFKAGISMSFIPEDRLGMGLAASMGIVDNMLLKTYLDSPGPFVQKKEARLLAETITKKLRISTSGMNAPVSRMSGGNVQKVLLGREIESRPQVLITAYPVRGLDINTSYTIYDALNAQKQAGTGVLFVCEDLDVMLELCDRIMVLCHGKVTGIVNAADTTKEELGLLMTNAQRKGDSPNAE